MTSTDVLRLARDPFSTAADPEFFYQSPVHQSALERLEMTLRARRGLSLVLGDLGTGKTTFGRVLAKSLATDRAMDVHLILESRYSSEFHFLETLCSLFRLNGPYRSTMDCLEALQQGLFQRGQVEGRTTVLIIDEGQNLSLSLLEVLRTLLNEEPHPFKLLQVVILTELETLPRLKRIPRLMELINFKYAINPFDFAECRQMIDFRLRQAGWGSSNLPFTDDAVRTIYERAEGYPLRITVLCQRLMDSLAKSGRTVAGADLVAELTSEPPSAHAYGGGPDGR